MKPGSPGLSIPDEIAKPEAKAERIEKVEKVEEGEAAYRAKPPKLARLKVE